MSLHLVRSPFTPHRPAATVPPPHVTLVSDVVAYVQQRFPEVHQETYRTQLCQGVYACDPWLIEPILLADLQKALRNEEAVETTRLRRMLRAVSWYLHPPVDTETLISFCADVFTGGAELDTVTEAIRSSLQGQNAETAVQIVERQLLRAYFVYGLKQHDLQTLLDQGYELTSREVQEAQLKRDESLDALHKLRAIRDQVYFQALYQGWYPS